MLETLQRRGFCLAALVKASHPPPSTNIYDDMMEKRNHKIKIRGHTPICFNRFENDRQN